MGLFDAPKPVGVEIRGNVLYCVICRHDRFWRRHIRLDPAELFHSDWFDPTVVAYTCDNCGYIHWFKPQ